MEIITRIAGSELPVKSELIVWSEFLELTGVTPSLLGELIELGWIEPRKTVQEQYLFRSRDVYRLRRLHRICRDLEINFEGASIIVDLLERVEHLEQKVEELKKLL